MSDRLLLGLRPHLILLMITFTLVHHRRPFVQASHVVRRAHGIYATSANNMDIGERTAPLISGAKETSTRPFQPQNSETAVNVHDKYNYYTDLSNSYDSIIHDSFESFLTQVHFFEKFEVSSSLNFKGVKGRLAKYVDVWISIGTNDFVIGTIKNGYIIPFLNPPVSMFMKNNKSAITNSEFVEQAITELVENCCAYEVSFKPYAVNPLSVAINKSGKKSGLF